MLEPIEPLSYAAPSARTSGLAITSLVLGVIAIPLDIALFVGVIPGFLAILFGLIALRNIRRNVGLRGKLIAQGGIILGVLSLLLALGCGILFFNGNL